MIPPSRLKEEECIIGQVAQENPVEHFETVRLTKVGEEIAISLSVSPVKDSSGKFITKTIQQVKKLTAPVSDLLNVSKIEAGKLQLLQENFDIKATLENAVELIQHSHNTHEITLYSSIDVLKVHGDTHRIEQVIINLFTNAIKYSYLANKVKCF